MSRPQMTKVDFVYSVIAKQIESGELRTGAKLYSLRRSADEFDVSKNTVVEAYDKLVATGLVSSRQGSGFIVNASRPTLNKSKPANIEEAVDTISLLRAQLDREFEVRVGDGRPPASWMTEIMPKRKLSQSPRSEIEDASGYGSPLGYRAFRECIAARQAVQGISLSPDQIVTTFGANHALDLIIRRYLSPGDTVLVDDPGYYPLFAKLRFSKIRMIGIRRTANGPDIEALRKAAEQERPALFFTQSLAQNPTGSSMDLPTAHAILTVAAEHNFLIVDDDPFVDLPNVIGTRLAALDQFDRVIFTGSYSKTLSASLRSGYIAARQDIVESLAELKMITTVNSSRYSEMLITDLHRNQRYQKHLKKTGKRVNEATVAVVSGLRDLGLVPFAAPTMGYYLMVKLPAHISDLELSRTASADGIFLAPGSLFFVDQSRAFPSLRINVTRADDGRFFRFLKTHL